MEFLVNAFLRFSNSSSLVILQFGHEIILREWENSKKREIYLKINGAFNDWQIKLEKKLE